MLNAPAPFPLPGSFALHEHEGQCRLARIIVRNRDGSAVVSLPERRDAGGNLSVPLAELLDGTPLTDAERAELDQLGRDLHAILRRKKRARTQRQKAGVERYWALTQRRINSRALAEKVQWFEELQRRQAAA